MSKVYVTKYALTKGILEFDAECVSGEMCVFRLPGAPFEQYVHRGDWWRTRDEAVAKAEQMRAKKLASLKKQVALVEALRFE